MKFNAYLMLFFCATLFNAIPALALDNTPSHQKDLKETANSKRQDETDKIDAIAEKEADKILGHFCVVEAHEDTLKRTNQARAQADEIEELSMYRTPELDALYARQDERNRERVAAELKASEERKQRHQATEEERARLREAKAAADREADATAGRIPLEFFPYAIASSSLRPSQSAALSAATEEALKAYEQQRLMLPLALARTRRQATVELEAQEAFKNRRPLATKIRNALNEGMNAAAAHIIKSNLDSEDDANDELDSDDAQTVLLQLKAKAHHSHLTRIATEIAFIDWQKQFSTKTAAKQDQITKKLEEAHQMSESLEQSTQDALADALSHLHMINQMASDRAKSDKASAKQLETAQKELFQAQKQLKGITAKKEAIAKQLRYARAYMSDKTKDPHLAELQEKRTKLIGAATLQEQEMQKMRDQLQLKQQFADSLESQLQDLTRQAATHHNNLQQHADLPQALSDLKAKHELLTEHLQTVAKEAEQRKEVLTKELASHTDYVAQYEAAHKALYESITQEIDTIEKHIQELDKDKTTLLALSTLTEEQKQTLLDLCTALDKEKNALAKLMTRKAQVEDPAHDISKDAAAAIQECNQSLLQLAQQAKDNQALAQEVDHINQAMEKLTSYQAHQAKNDAERNYLALQLAQVAAKIEKIESEFGRHMIDRNALQAQLESMRTARATHQADMHAIDQALEKHQQSLEHAKKEYIEDLNNQIKALHKEKEQRMQEYQTTKEKINADAAACKRREEQALENMAQRALAEPGSFAQWAKDHPKIYKAMETIVTMGATVTAIEIVKHEIGKLLGSTPKSS